MNNVEKRNESRVRRIPAQRRSRITVDSLLEAAEMLLKEQEYSCITTTMIAERAGFTVGSLYQYFTDKQAIFAALFESKSRIAARELEELISEYIPTETRKINHFDLANIAIKKLIDLYEEEEIVLIKLIEEAPDLKESTQASSLEHLIMGMSEEFLVSYGASPEKKNIDLMNFMIDNILFVNVKKYVSQSPRPFEKEQLIKELSTCLVAYYDYKGMRREPPGDNAK